MLAGHVTWVPSRVGPANVLVQQTAELPRGQTTIHRGGRRARVQEPSSVAHGGSTGLLLRPEVLSSA